MKYDYIFVGLGNPGEEYRETRHNAGRMVLESLVKKAPEGMKVTDWQEDKKIKALISEVSVGKKKILLVLPETFMNNSGNSLKPLALSPKSFEKLVVLRDDVDLPLGRIKMTFNRGTGGHRGVESIKKAIKSEGFVQIKIGISPSTPSGKIKKPKPEKVVDFVIGKFKAPELEIYKKVSKKIKEALEVLVKEGRERAMNGFN